MIVAVARTCFFLVDLDLSNCHVLDTGTFGVLSMLNNLNHLNVYRTQIGNNELKLILASNKVRMNLSKNQNNFNDSNIFYSQSDA